MSRRLHYTPQIDPTAFVAPTATVLGDVALAEEASVWFGAVLRGDNDAIRVGARTNIQDQAIIHVDPDAPVTIGADVTVGHRAIIHGATVEDGCLIGMGAIVLNSAVVGAGSIVGAGAVVREREIIPPRSLVVGIPAKVVRQLTDAQVQENVASAARYVANSRAYLAYLSQSSQD
ncbi:MAG: gamma carbonic anhydrase family protein [Anaerolineae bacterium]|nr:gamma carbonic anhydrase family protein [Anaerolineae bacterium]